MATMQIRILSKPQHVDPVKDARGRLKAGDIVTAHNDGHQWSESEQNAVGIKILNLPGVAVDDIAAYLQPILDGDQPVTARRWKVDVAALTPVVVENLQNATIPAATRLADFSTLMIDKT